MGVYEKWFNMIPATQIRKAVEFIKDQLVTDYVAADAVVTSAHVAADTVVTSAHVAADTVVNDARVAVGQVAKITLDSADILDLYDTEIELVATPGVGKIVVVDSVSVFMDHGGTDYVFNGVWSVTYTDKSGDKATSDLSQAFGQVSADAWATVIPAAVTPVAAAPVVISAAGTDPITGNGTADVHISYHIVDNT